MVDTRIELLDYIATRIRVRDDCLPFMFPHYLNFLVKLIDTYLDVSLSAANKVFKRLKNNENPEEKILPLTNSEILALNVGELGSIISRVEEHGLNDKKIIPSYMRFFKPALVTTAMIAGSLTYGLGGTVIGGVTSYILPDAINELSKHCKRAL